jgi:hypothetical protein
MALYMLGKIRMVPLKRHQIGGPQIVQLCGLLILIEMSYKCFGTGVVTHLTPASVLAFAFGVFMLVWPMSIKARR